MDVVAVTLDGAGGAYIALAGAAGGEVRHSVELDELDEAETVPALGALALDFDFYGRLCGIRVSTAATVLPPALLEAATDA